MNGPLGVLFPSQSEKLRPDLGGIETRILSFTSIMY